MGGRGVAKLGLPVGDRPSGVTGARYDTHEEGTPHGPTSKESHGVPLDEPVRSRRVPRKRLVPDRSADPGEQPGTRQGNGQSALQAVRCVNRVAVISSVGGT